MKRAEQKTPETSLLSRVVLLVVERQQVTKSPWCEIRYRTMHKTIVHTAVLVSSVQRSVESRVQTCTGTQTDRTTDYSKIGRRRTPRRRTPRLENWQNLRTVQARIIRFKNTFKIWNIVHVWEVSTCHVHVRVNSNCYMYSHSHLRHPLV